MDPFLLFWFRVCFCYSDLSVLCSLVITCQEMAGILALLCDVFSCVYVTYLNGVPGQQWYLIVYTCLDKQKL